MPDRKANIPERPCLRAVQVEPKRFLLGWIDGYAVRGYGSPIKICKHIFAGFALHTFAASPSAPRNDVNNEMPLGISNPCGSIGFLRAEPLGEREVEDTA